jgi:hypothetical protein
MLFNSPGFFVGFLPICLAGFYCFGIAGSQRLALAWLTGMSLVFYAWWSLACVPLLLGSIAFNFFVGRKLARSPSKRLLLISLEFLHPSSQELAADFQIPSRLRDRHAALRHQLYRLKLELSRKSPSLHNPPPVP